MQLYDDFSLFWADIYVVILNDGTMDGYMASDLWNIAFSLHPDILIKMSAVFNHLLNQALAISPVV